MATIPMPGRDEGTEKSLAAITAEDLRAYHKAVFARENLHVAVVGAIDAETLKRELDKLFGGLPEKPALRPVAKVDWKLGQEVSGGLRAAADLAAACLSGRRPRRRRISSPPS